MYMMFWVIGSLGLLIGSLAGVAFLTLLERKVLGLSQVRYGPNKTFYLGLLQPVSDGLKLFMKELYYLLNMFSGVMILSSTVIFSLYFLIWVYLFSWNGQLLVMKYSGVIFFGMLGLSSYGVVLTGWGCLSSFSKLGSLRSILQSLSYEVAIILWFMVVMKSFGSTFLSNEMSLSEAFILWIVLWLILSLMETNRAPFDLVEGESELISGFNIELGSIGFTFLFLSEYGMILVMSLLTLLGVLGCGYETGLLVCVSVLFVRSCFPRVRYDIMMNFMWMMVLPFSVWWFWGAVSV